MVSKVANRWLLFPSLVLPTLLTAVSVGVIVGRLGFRELLYYMWAASFSPGLPQC